MNSFKIIGIISIVSVSSVLQSMERLQNPLSAIEKQLVLREVAKRGRDVVEKEVLKQRDNKMCHDKKNNQFYFTIPPKLKIKETFSQPKFNFEVHN